MNPAPSTADYWIGPVIGEGSFAHVHYATEKQNNASPVAIKVIEQVSFRRNPQLLQCVLQEQKLLARMQRQQSTSIQLAKKNTARNDLDRVGPEWAVGLWSSFYDSQCLYLVLELCQGGDLQGLIQQGRRNVEDELRWFSSIPYYANQIRSAVNWLHREQGIVHCDIKPKNILMDSNGKVRLADFGSALELEDAKSADFMEIPRGTVEYSSPEILRGRQANLSNGDLQAMDYWSVGCVVYEMFVGRSPFHRDDGSEFLITQSILEYADKKVPFATDYSCTRETLQVPTVWQGCIQGLLHFGMPERSKTWGDLDCLEKEMLSTADNQGDHTKPKAEWRDEVDGCSLRDGKQGWIAFMM